MRKIELTEGIHYLSGIETNASLPNPNGWDDEELEGDLLVIDGVTYAAFIDPDDGYRSYGVIMPIDMECRYTFAPQKVEVKFEERIAEEDDCGWYYEHVRYISILDAILKKEVLRIGTDYSDSYYPTAIFDYQPMNLYVNVERSIRQNEKK